MVSNILNSVTVNTNGVSHKYDLSHLKNSSLNIEGVKLENGLENNVKINVLPTNHVYSTDLKLTGKDKKDALRKSGHLLISYKHDDRDISKLTLHEGEPTIKEHRRFDNARYQQSFHLIAFIKQLEKRCNQKCILANGGDDQNCLSGLFFIPNTDSAYLVIFRLKKIKALEINMIIETAYIEKIKDDHRLQKLHEPKTRQESNKLKPFTTLVINTLAGRAPFEGKYNDKRNRRRKKPKKKEK
jgi:hypothetical protein